MLYKTALFLVLISAAGFVLYLIRQKRIIFRYSFFILFAGFIFHTAFLIYGFYLLKTAPVICLSSSLSFFAWCITGVYLLFHIRFGLMVLGSFVAPVAAVLMIVSSAMPSMETRVPEMLKSVWLTAHVFFMFAGDGIFVITLAAAVMYLIQERQIKSKSRGSLYKRLPSLETLDSINHYTLIYGFSLITVGMITGAIYARYALGSYWRWDPKEVWSLVTWIFYAVLLHQRLTVGWRGRRAALMSVLCFCILLFTFLGGSLWLSDYHSFENMGVTEGK